jgi:hypothetical protein
MPGMPLQFGGLGIDDFRRLRPHLAEQEQIAALDLLGADHAEPLAPVCRDIEPCIRKRPMVWRHLLEWYRIVEFHAQGDHGVFLAVINPGRGIVLGRLEANANLTPGGWGERMTSTKGSRVKAAIGVSITDPVANIGLRNDRCRH